MVVTPAILYELLLNRCINPSNGRTKHVETQKPPIKSPGFGISQHHGSGRVIRGPPILYISALSGPSHVASRSSSCDTRNHYFLSLPAIFAALRGVYLVRLRTGVTIPSRPIRSSASKLFVTRHKPIRLGLKYTVARASTIRQAHQTSQLPVSSDEPLAELPMISK